MQALIGQKKEQSQRFLENGKRIPVTLIDVKGNTIVSLKTLEQDHYQAVQLGFSMKKNSTKAELGHVKGAKLEKAPKFLKEVRILDDSDSMPEIGAVLNPAEVFEPGDMVDVSGFSKGKGFQGGVKRHGFHGGPKTHGQSDRHRAPGSIGQGTTPGRVYKGKRMAGNMGNDNVTIKNLEIIDVTVDGVLVVKGLVPGIIDGMMFIKKIGTDKNFIPLYKNPEEKIKEEAASAKMEEVGGDTEAAKETTDEKKEEVKTEEAEKSAEQTSDEPKIDDSEAETEENAGKKSEQKGEVKEEGESADPKAIADKKDAK